MKNEDIEIGQHCWAILNNELLVVLKTDDESYSVCGNWECSVDASIFDILEIIDRPKGHEDTKLYYMI